MREGTSRPVVESQLGLPVRVTALAEGGLSCEYQHQAGNSPSTNRAVGHAVLDVITLGYWEVFGWGYELSRGTTVRTIIEYDDRNIARSISLGTEAAE